MPSVTAPDKRQFFANPFAISRRLPVGIACNRPADYEVGDGVGLATSAMKGSCDFLGVFDGAMSVAAPIPSSTCLGEPRRAGHAGPGMMRPGRRSWSWRNRGANRPVDGNFARAERASRQHAFLLPLEG